MEKKVCPFTMFKCPSDDFPCALYDEKRKCCALIPEPQKIMIPENFFHENEGKNGTSIDTTL